MLYGTKPIVTTCAMLISHILLYIKSSISKMIKARIICCRKLISDGPNTILLNIIFWTSNKLELEHPIFGFEHRTDWIWVIMNIHVEHGPTCVKTKKVSWDNLQTLLFLVMGGFWKYILWTNELQIGRGRIYDCHVSPFT